MTNDLIANLESLRERALADLAGSRDLDRLETWRVAVLGSKGELRQLQRGLGAVRPDDRPTVGQAFNRTKTALEAAYTDRRARLEQASLDKAFQAERVDVTMPGRAQALGRLHPTTIMIEQILDFFGRMGFQVVEGPEVEKDFYNFHALNIPQDHPARDMWDTIYVNPPEVLLRTHTSPMQARVMEQQQPPVRVVVPGRCYRYEAQDATHEWMFYQIEGLAVDEGLTMADLKGTLGAFARAMFRPDVRTRFRCDYFPFVEPGVDMSISCHICNGVGCRVCKHSGWIEIMGAGMVHPRVLEMVGYDPERYTGWAFGMGPERIAMLKYGIPDIRYFYGREQGNDLRFLEQFR
ncbi:MAG: phenylalanine--tRNA ligase subunit alpha [Chloroflexi bacterium]|nr:phenylalanine--tRNA ligase subunit alpha [Chloroflexota bacterium]